MSTPLTPAEVEASLVIARSVVPTWFKGQSDVTGRGSVILYLMRKWGLISVGENWATAGTWALKNKLPEVIPFTDRQQLTYTQVQPRFFLTLRQKSFITRESISYHEQLYNRAKSQIVALMKDKSESLKAAAERNLCRRFYDDSADAATNLDGIETPLNTGTTVATDKVAKPSGSYAGQDIALGSRGGGWSTDKSPDFPNASVATDWPENQAASDSDSSYDDMAPLILNTSSSAWDNGNGGWKANAEEIMAYMATWQEHRVGSMLKKAGQPSVHLLNTGMMLDFKNSMRSRNQQMVPVQEGVDFGLPETFNFDGRWVTRDYHVPNDTGYFLTPEFLEFACPEDTLFKVHEEIMKMTDQFVIPMAVTTFGNFRLQPRTLGAYKAVA